MWGIELADPLTGRRASGLAEQVQAAALRAGLILELGGRDDCVVRLLPPLNVTAEVVDIACTIILGALDVCGKGLPVVPSQSSGPAAGQATAV
jgi:diaminobutyrate-2-oxoglutarate transaminase